MKPPCALGEEGLCQECGGCDYEEEIEIKKHEEWLEEEVWIYG